MPSVSEQKDSKAEPSGQNKTVRALPVLQGVDVTPELVKENMRVGLFPELAEGIKVVTPK